MRERREAPYSPLSPPAPALFSVAHRWRLWIYSRGKGRVYVRRRKGAKKVRFIFGIKSNSGQLGIKRAAEEEGESTRKMGGGKEDPS